MGQLVYILGRSGTGKSYSLRNFDKGEIAVVNVQGKILPFKGAERIEAVTCDDSSEIVEYIKTFSKRYKRIVVDDFQYVMANEFMILIPMQKAQKGLKRLDVSLMKKSILRE